VSSVASTSITSTRRHVGQRGVALYVVLMFMLLSVLLALWASRTALFGEIVVGNDADYQRAFEAAQALLQDAELDIREETATGDLCHPCRQGYQQIPVEGLKITEWITQIENEPTRCKDALCVRRVGRQDFWNHTVASGNPSPPANAELGEVTLDGAGGMTSVGARYGQYTGAGTGGVDTPINPILTDHAAGKGGWYWIEVLPYDESSQFAGVVTPDPDDPPILALSMDPNVVFRITALAHGRKPGTRVVLQETYVRKRRMD
jgi:type IV pilus assembly protein PilX